LLIRPQQKLASNIDSLKLQKCAKSLLSNFKISRKKLDICLHNKFLSATLWNCTAEVKSGIYLFLQFYHEEISKKFRG
jgi:hypothetical protein